MPDNLPFDADYFQKQGSDKSIPVKEIFSDIYRRNHWNGQASVSGPGSDLEQTRSLREILPAFVAEWCIGSILDIPCGDFYWMQHVLWPRQVHYTGADIVPELIEHHRQHYASPRRSFRVLNLLDDELPAHDLIFCRDCLVHLSNSQIKQALHNMLRSGSTWLLCTHFPERGSHADISTGDWRPLDMEAEPLCLPTPRLVINEGCTEANGQYKDKSLGLWLLAEMANWLAPD